MCKNKDAGENELELKLKAKCESGKEKVGKEKQGKGVRTCQDAANQLTDEEPGKRDIQVYFRPYSGREIDVEIQIQFNRERYYDPTTGRWISQDPMGFDAGDSNLYRYVNNRPTGATDPSGLESAYARNLDRIHSNPAAAEAHHRTMVSLGGIGISLATAAWLSLRNAIRPNAPAPVNPAPAPIVQPQPNQVGQPVQVPQGQQNQNQLNPDHVFTRGFGRNLRGFSTRVATLWTALSQAFAAAYPQTQTPPFGLVDNLQRPRPDPQSIAFGLALMTMRSAIESYNQTATQQGAAAAKQQHRGQLLAAWNALVDVIEDPVAAAAHHQQGLVVQGRASLLRIKLDVGGIIQNDP